MADDAIDLSAVAATDVAAVLAGAADLIGQHGWSPVHTSDGRLTVLQAITQACDAVSGPGIESAELHMAACDAVCISATGKLCGTGASVSRWERSVADEAATSAIRRCQPDIVATLRGAA